ncbi:MAG: hypothetical protein RJS98_02230 [Rhodospirillaceae bacterium]
MELRTDLLPGKGKAVRALLLGTAAMLVASCSEYTDYDPSAGLQKEDYEQLLNRRSPEQGAQMEEPPIPDFQPVLAAPSAPELADVRRVSISVTDSTPLRDILIELARKAGVDLEMDPRISGGIIYTATDRPFVEVIERIAELGELRYQFRNNSLKVELDEPYISYYRLDYPDLTRTASSTSQTTTDVSNAIQGAGGGSGTSQSDVSVSSSSNSDFWSSVGEGIEQILGATNTEAGSNAQAREQAFTPSTTAADAEDEDSDSDTQSLVEGATGVEGLENPLLADRGSSGVGARSIGQPTQGASIRSAFFSVNQQAGIVTVFASQKQQKLIADYIDRLRRSVLAQVLIEAKIVEVTLSDQFRTGVDWSSFGGIDPATGNAAQGPWAGDNQTLDFTSNFARNVATDSFPDPTIGLIWNNTDLDLNLAVSLINAFGTTRTLSSPRVTVVNNQTALLKVAENEVFFEINVEFQPATDTSASVTTFDSQVQTVPVGIVMAVQPAIDPDGQRISMSMRPSITRLVRRIEDPGVQLQLAQINAQNGTNLAVSSAVPVIETRELDSIVTMESGQVVVMGGLMQEIAINSREGAPGLMDVPLLGRAFGQDVRETQVIELVIFLRATIVGDRDTVHDEDIRLYNKFAPDPRPLVF